MSAILPGPWQIRQVSGWFSAAVRGLVDRPAVEVEVRHVGRRVVAGEAHPGDRRVHQVLLIGRVRHRDVLRGLPRRDRVRPCHPACTRSTPARPGVEGEGDAIVGSGRPVRSGREVWSERVHAHVSRWRGLARSAARRVLRERIAHVPAERAVRDRPVEAVRHGGCRVAVAEVVRAGDVAPFAEVQDSRIRHLGERRGRGRGVPGELGLSLRTGVNGVHEVDGVRRPAAAGPVRRVAPRAGGPVVPLSGVERVLGEGAELLVAGVAALVLDDCPSSGESGGDLVDIGGDDDQAARLADVRRGCGAGGQPGSPWVPSTGYFARFVWVSGSVLVQLYEYPIPPVSITALVGNGHPGERSRVVAVGIGPGQGARSRTGRAAVPDGPQVAADGGVEVRRRRDSVLRHREHEVEAGPAHEVVPDLLLSGRRIGCRGREVVEVLRADRPAASGTP